MTRSGASRCPTSSASCPNRRERLLPLDFAFGFDFELLRLPVPPRGVRDCWLSRELLDDLRLELAELFLREELLRRPPLFARWSRGTTAWTTLPLSCSIWPATYLAMRSSSRRMPFASFAVSLSPTFSANAWIVL